MPDSQNATGTTPPVPPPDSTAAGEVSATPPDLSGIRYRTFQQAKAELPQVEATPPWEEEPRLNVPPTTTLGKAYDAAKGWLGEHEQHVSEKYLAPFREGLDRMAEDLQAAGETGHTKTGGQLTTPSRLLVSTVGQLLRWVPVGKDVKETVQAMAVPPELGPEGKALSKELKAGEKVAEKAAPNFEGLRVREISLGPKPSAAKELPPQPRLPDTGTHAAIKTDDGGIYFDDAPEKQRTHIMLAQDLGIPPERVVSGGWLKDGEYEGSERSDAGRWGEQARAKAAVAEKRVDRTKVLYHGTHSGAAGSIKQQGLNAGMLTDSPDLAREEAERAANRHNIQTGANEKPVVFQVSAKPEEITDRGEITSATTGESKGRYYDRKAAIPAERVKEFPAAKTSPQAEQLVSRAKEVFGTTKDANEAGFILPSGEMLDFSGKKAKSTVAPEVSDPKTRTEWYGGKRVLDHRDIWQAFPEDYKKPADANYLKLFERQANAVRFSTAAGDVNVSFNEGVKPTSEQLTAIRKAIQSEQGGLNVDFYDKNGRVVKSLEKDFARPSDLDNFVSQVFPEGKEASLKAPQAAQKAPAPNLTGLRTRKISPAPEAGPQDAATDEEIVKHFESKYPVAKETVDGRKVREAVPNLSSIGASLNKYKVLGGVREVPMSEFPAAPEITARTKQLAEDIKKSGEINPLIVAVDHEGPYILEGGHRYDALKINGAKSFPAVVVTDLEEGTRAKIPSPQTEPPSIYTPEGAKPLAEKLGAKVVGSVAKKGATPGDLDLRIEGDYKSDEIESKLKAEGFESRGSSVVSPKEQQASGKDYGKPGWKRAEHFENAAGQKIDVWHDEADPQPWEKHPATENIAKEAEQRGNELVFRRVRSPEEAQAILESLDKGKPSEGFRTASVIDGHALSAKAPKIQAAINKGAVPIFTSPYPTAANWYKGGADLFLAIEHTPEGKIYTSSRAGQTQGASYSATFPDAEHVIDARSIKNVSVLSPEQVEQIAGHEKNFEQGIRRGAFKGAYKDVDPELARANLEAARNLSPVVKSLGRPFVEAPIEISSGLKVKKGDRVRFANGTTGVLSNYREFTPEQSAQFWKGEKHGFGLTGVKGELPTHYEGETQDSARLNQMGRDITAVWDKENRKWVEAGSQAKESPKGEPKKPLHERLWEPKT